MTIHRRRPQRNLPILWNPSAQEKLQLPVNRHNQVRRFQSKNRRQFPRRDHHRSHLKTKVPVRQHVRQSLVALPATNFWILMLRMHPIRLVRGSRVPFLKVGYHKARWRHRRDNAMSRRSAAFTKWEPGVRVRRPTLISASRIRTRFAVCCRSSRSHGLLWNKWNNAWQQYHMHTRDHRLRRFLIWFQNRMGYVQSRLTHAHLKAVSSSTVSYSLRARIGSTLQICKTLAFDTTFRFAYNPRYNALSVVGATILFVYIGSSKWSKEACKKLMLCYMMNVRLYFRILLTQVPFVIVFNKCDRMNLNASLYCERRLDHNIDRGCCLWSANMSKNNVYYQS